VYPRALTLLLLLALLAGCEGTAYIGQAAWGQTRLLLARRDIDSVIEDRATGPELRERLQLVREMRRFAVAELAMGDVRGLQEYVELGRDHAVWNVVASPEFELRAETWCFPVAGCVNYRGYFSQAAAQRFAAQLAGRGFDTQVYGVAAYSTLGWFDDPVLDTWLTRQESALAALVFHEFAHQIVYVAGDTAFSEGFANIVEREGVRRWLQRHGAPGRYEDYLLGRQLGSQFAGLLAQTQQQLLDLYAQPLPAHEMRLRKETVFEQLRASYAQQSASWPQQHRMDGWMRAPLNNARVLSVANYEQWVPALQRMLDDCARDMPCFYQSAQQLARLDSAQRHQRLRELAPADFHELVPAEPGQER